MITSLPKFKSIAHSAIFFVALLGLSLPARAYDFADTCASGQVLYYNITDANHTVSVTHPGTSIYNPYNGYAKPTGSLIIPVTVTYNAIPYTVTSIDNYAFEDCSGLTSIIIGNSVTSIGSYAFRNCDSLTSVTIGDSVTTISSHAFSSCSGLTSVTIPNSVTTIGDDAFGSCSGLTSVTIPNSVTTIGHYAFMNCSGLTSIIIGNSVTTISSYAFEGCSNLTNVTIPNSVTYIGNYAFWDCSGLTSITIGDSVTYIGSHAFMNCSNLTSVTIPNSVTTISDHTFYLCSGLTSVTIGNSVTSIGNSVTSIGNSAFVGCSGLTSVTIGNSVTSIGSYAFEDCSGLTSITIGNSVTSIGSNAFEGCSGLTSIIISDSVTSIGSYAFKNCSNLTSVTSNAEIAPVIASTTFQGVSNAIQLVVPCGSRDSYLSTASGWLSNIELNNIKEIGSVELTTAVNDSTKGTVYTLVEPKCDNHMALIFALATDSTRFVAWSDGDTLNPRPIWVDSGTSITAFFDIDTAVVDNYIHDTIIITNTVFDTVTLYDTTFIDNYIHDTTVVTNTVYDTVTLTQYDTITLTQYDTITVTQPLTYYTLSVGSDNMEHGFAAGNGTFPDSTEVEIAAIPLQGYHFVSWQDGNTDNPRLVLLTGDASYTASFDEQVGVVAIDAATYTVGTDDMRIVVRGAEGQRIRIYDNQGRLLSNTQSAEDVRIFDMPATGIYMVQVGNDPAHRVVLIH